MANNHWIVLAFLLFHGVEALVRTEAGDDLAADSVPKFLMVNGYWKLEGSDIGNQRNDANLPSSLPVVMSLNTPTVISGNDAGLASLQAARSNMTNPLIGF